MYTIHSITSTHQLYSNNKCANVCTFRDDQANTYIQDSIIYNYPQRNMIRIPMIENRNINSF